MEELLGLQATALPGFFLVLARVSGLFLFAPIFSSKIIPARLKVLVALALSLAALPIAIQTPAPTDVAELAVLVVKELLVGSAIGFSVGVVLAAIQFAGAFIDLVVGFAFANVVDPMQNTQVSILGTVYSMIGSVVFLAIGGHAMLIAALVRSFEAVPVTTMPQWAAITRGTVGATGALLQVGLQIAAPIVVTLVVTDIAVGFLARLAPSMNIFAVELPVKILAMFALLALTAPFLVGSLGDHIEDGLVTTSRMISEMSP